MIKNGYLMIGIIYIAVAVLYVISIFINLGITFVDYLSKPKQAADGEEVNGEIIKKSETNSLSYKIYWYFNNIRYVCFILLYLAIGVIYILGQIHENRHEI